MDDFKAWEMVSRLYFGEALTEAGCSSEKLARTKSYPNATQIVEVRTTRRSAVID